ncbi:hypothetical protein C1H46_004830 [Malus baccata]|uniref:Uncharacterized protein n=1 Tax=Malus baccata TaxID=106549 RepID=A0A540NF10_MALBA|nr:hypothetical protein C1H46_004830 [Malus baccata]
MTDQEANTSAPTMTGMIVDDTYEFSALRFFDFIKEESEDDWRKAELWFDCALAYALSHTSASLMHLSILLLFYSNCAL